MASNECALMFELAKIILHSGNTKEERETLASALSAYRSEPTLGSDWCRWVLWEMTSRLDTSARMEIELGGADLFESAMVDLRVGPQVLNLSHRVSGLYRHLNGGEEVLDLIASSNTNAVFRLVLSLEENATRPVEKDLWRFFVNCLSPYVGNGNMSSKGAKRPVHHLKEFFTGSKDLLFGYRLLPTASQLFVSISYHETVM